MVINEFSLRYPQSFTEVTFIRSLAFSDLSPPIIRREAAGSAYLLEAFFSGLGV